MVQTKQGAAKAQQTIISKYGLTEDGKSALHVRAGKKGGQNGFGTGFAMQPKEKVRAAGRRGGAISRRGKAIHGKKIIK